jgi:hypothetical protein
MTTPKFFFIGRKALADTPERVKEALRLTPVAGVFVTCDLDAKLASELSEAVHGFHQPFAFVADFPFNIAHIDDQGKLVPGELPVIEEEKK